MAPGPGEGSTASPFWLVSGTKPMELMHLNLYLFILFLISSLFTSVGISQAGYDSVGHNSVGFQRCSLCACWELQPQSWRGAAGRVSPGGRVGGAGRGCCCGITALNRDDRADTVSPGLVPWHKGFFLVQPRMPLAFSFPEQPVSYPLAVHFGYLASYSPSYVV